MKELHQSISFICDPQLPHIVVGVHCGVDGVVRRADVKTTSNVLQRALSRRMVLDLSNCETSCFAEEGVLIAYNLLSDSCIIAMRKYM